MKNVSYVVPEHDVNEITIVNARSNSFDFLFDEPELYSLVDVKKIAQKKK